ncbi:MAG TPA: molybdenum cofactor guanylyltransferase MobA [Roseiarcus sp.]|nr:molybdenum cofactor guanylyltransferase MobA [Roseiarcus sp.]
MRRSPIHSEPIAGVVLAGGRSTRMGAEKALLPLAGRALVAHVVERLRPQVAELFINANGDAARFASLDCAVVADEAATDLAGPLRGIGAAIAFARRRGFSLLATAPCDAPFLPLDLVARLAAAMAASGAQVAVAESARGLEPMFALWRESATSEIAAEFERGEASPRAVMARLGAARVFFAPGDGDDPFANLNSPEDFAAAEARMADPRYRADQARRAVDN